MIPSLAVPVIGTRGDQSQRTEAKKQKHGKPPEPISSGLWLFASSFLCTSICQHMRDQHTVAMEHDQFSVAFHCLPWPKEAGSKRAQGGGGPGSGG